jgi:excisionase family DNA binding protein
MPSMSVKQGAQYLGVSVPTMWRLVLRREVGHVKIGRRTILLQAELDRFLQKSTVPAKHETPSPKRAQAAG